MTQEELDALMDEDLEAGAGTDGAALFLNDAETGTESYRPEAANTWPPPPPTNQHRVVHQLDDVAREGEEKSSQIFDILDSVGSDAAAAEETVGRLIDHIAAVADTFARLHDHFPNIQTFTAQLERCNELKTLGEQIKAVTQKTNDQIMVAMDVLQYQDIHRQKIERVINVMRTLSHYMSSLFDSKVADEKRVSSAVHLTGDNTADLVNEQDIEALISAFGSK